MATHFKDRSEDGLNDFGTAYSVLVIARSFADRRMITQMLRSRQYNVCAELDNGEQASVMLKSKNPALIIVGYDLPGKNGIEVTKKLFALDGTLKFIIFSENKFNFVESDALAAGAKLFYIKPFDRENFLDMVKQVINTE